MPDIYEWIESCARIFSTISRVSWSIEIISVSNNPYPSARISSYTLICTNNWPGNRIFAVDPFLAHVRINNNQGLNCPHRATLRGTFCPCNLPTTAIYVDLSLLAYLSIRPSQRSGGAYKRTVVERDTKQYSATYVRSRSDILSSDRSRVTRYVRIRPFPLVHVRSPVLGSLATL